MLLAQGYDVEDWLQPEQELEEEQKRFRTLPRAATAKP